MVTRSKEYYAKHYRDYQGTSEQIANRAQRNAARATLEKTGAVHKGDGKDVHHKRDISVGGTNARSNLSVKSKAANRAHWGPGKKP